MGIKRIEKKLDSKIKKMSFVKKNLVLIFLVFVLVSFMSIGYSALNQTLNITGEVALRTVKDIRITDLRLNGNNTGSGYEKYNSKFTVNTIQVFVGLTEIKDSVTYKATIKNIGNVDMEINKITGDLSHDDATYSINGLYKELIISAGTERDFLITVSRSKNSSSELKEIEANLSLEIGWKEYTPKYLAYYIEGNSAQDGIPSPTSPVEIQSVGDKTINLFDATNWESLTTENGVTVQYMKDEGYFILNGTVKSTGRFAEKYINLPIVNGSKFSISYEYVSGTVTRVNTSDYATIYFGANNTINTRTNWQSVNVYEYDNKKQNLSCAYDYITSFWFYATGGVTFTDYKIKVQLEEGAVAHAYELYGKYKIPITLSGKNLIPYPYKNTTKTLNGITFTDNGDGTITANGTASANSDFELTGTFEIKKGMVISGGVSGDSTRTYEVFVNGTDGTILHSYSNSPADHDFTANRIFIRIRPGATVNNLVFKPMLEFNTSATEYEPYVEPITKNIYLDEPLRKLGDCTDCADYIDFSTSIINRNVREKTLVGTENWVKTAISSQSNTTRYTVVPLDNDLRIGTIDTKSLNTHFGYVAYGTDAMGFLGSTDNANYSIKSDILNDVTAFKQWFIDENAAGTPVTVNYLLATTSNSSIDLPEIIKKPFYTNVEIGTTIQPTFTYTWE